MIAIPEDFEVQPIASDHPDAATCGTCGMSWNDSVSTSWTPVPSGRCPFEYFHEEVTGPTSGTVNLELRLRVAYNIDTDGHERTADGNIPHFAVIESAHKMCARIAQADFAPSKWSNILDGNGNTIGQFRLTDVQEED